MFSLFKSNDLWQDELKVELKKAIQKHYHKLKEEHRDLYGYCLYTSDSFMGLGPVSITESAIKEHEGKDDYSYYRYGADEWDLWGGNEEFKKVSSIIKDKYANLNFSKFANGLKEASLNSLLELEADGFFGPITDKRFLCIYTSDSSDSIMVDSVKKLNTNNTYEEFLKI